MTYTLTTDGRTLSATEEQAAIVERACSNLSEHLLINALAGAAKTSTLEFLCKYLPEMPILSIAFNKRIAEKMAQVLPKHVRASTVNSLGHRTWGAAIGKRLTLNTKKSYELVRAEIDKLPKREQREAWDCFSDLMKALSKAKINGYVPSGPMGRSLISHDDFYGSLEEAPDSWFVSLCDRALAQSIVQSYKGLIDFDDQIYMPTLFGGSWPQFPQIMIDEAQDLNPLQHEMTKHLVGPKSRLTAVGDPWQSIYAFRGADTASMSKLKERFDMHEMTLSVSFRCPIKVIQKAHSRVPHMKWPGWAIEGVVETLDSWNAECIPDNSAIICRNNAPLMKTALALLRAGRGVQLVGTDLGPQLTKALKRLSTDTQLPQGEVLQLIDAWEAEKMRKSRNASAVADKAECLRVFASFGPTLGSAIAYCEHLFAAKGPIQLLSGHKAKGLEWDVVYHLDPHRIPSPYAKADEEINQELNVRYVIETRAKRELYLVRLDNFTEETEE